MPSVTHTGTVRGLTYTNNGNGTATLSGTPATAGTYTLTITARNSVGSVTQAFTLTVEAEPAGAPSRPEGFPARCRGPSGTARAIRVPSGPAEPEWPPV